MMVTVGVLGLQGAVREHVKALETSGAQTKIVKRVDELEEIDGLVFPGGESTTMRRLMDKYGFMEPIKTFSESKKPIFGTCAGLILLAKAIEGYEDHHLGLMDIKVKRNAFGRQRESFEAVLSIKGVAEDFVGVFIRAPYIVEVGKDVDVLAKFNERIVAAREGHLLVSAFHPELTDDHRFHRYFVNMVQETTR